MVFSAERQTPPGSDPAPTVILVILLPRQGRRKGRVSGADGCPGGRRR